MKKWFALFLIGLLALGVSSSEAAIGWAGGVYPCDGDTRLDNADIDVYVQIWKDACTPGAGACPGLEAFLFYKKASEGTYTSLAMSYWGEVDNNDEYKGTIPEVATAAGDDEMFYVDVHDITDDTWFYGAKNQWTCPGGEKDPPFVLHISPAISQDVTVTFRVDMGCLDPSWYSGGAFVAGGFNSWSGCTYAMLDPDGDFIYEAQYTFLAGSNPFQEYKFNKSTGSCDWEGGSNRTFVIDDSSPTQILPVEMWDRWDCCTPSGPAAISAPGSYCVHLCYCEEYLDIPLTVAYDPPVIPLILFVPGCELGPTPCNEVCDPGAGVPVWQIVEIAPHSYVLRLCVPRVAGADYGCFCMTIEQILPVELTSFEATPLDHAVRLDWTTATETDNDHFVIESSLNQTEWNTVTEVPSLGNSPSGHSYHYVHEGLAAGVTYYYRLTNVDVSGASTLYPHVANATPLGAVVAAEYALSQNYPNPFNPTTAITFSLRDAGTVAIKVFDVTGHDVATLVSGHMTAGSHTVSFDASALPSGLYFYRLQAGDFTATRKMVLMK